MKWRRDGKIVEKNKNNLFQQNLLMKIKNLLKNAKKKKKKEKKIAKKAGKMILKKFPTLKNYLKKLSA